MSSPQFIVEGGRPLVGSIRHDAAALRLGRGGDDAEGDMGFSRVNETHAEQIAGGGIVRGDGLARVERGVNCGEEAEGFVAVAEACALAEPALIPVDERAVEQACGLAA